MFALILGTVFSAGFGVVMRHAQGAKRNLWAVGVTNYVVATLFQFVRYVAGGTGEVAWTTVLLGMVTGTLYGLNFWFYFRLMRTRGVSITNAVGRLSVLLPVTVGVLVWHQRLVPSQMVGVALAVAALPLLTLQPAAIERRLGPEVWWFSLAMFMGSGLSSLVVDAHRQLAPNASGPAFLAVLFCSAGVVATIGWWRAGHAFAWRDVPHGAALGLTNALANAGLVAALASLPGVIVFPFYSAVGLAIVAVVARVIWGESLGRLEMSGMGATLAAVVLMNLG